MNFHSLLVFSNESYNPLLYRTTHQNLFESCAMLADCLEQAFTYHVKGFTLVSASLYTPT